MTTLRHWIDEIDDDQTTDTLLDADEIRFAGPALDAEGEPFDLGEQYQIFFVRDHDLVASSTPAGVRLLGYDDYSREPVIAKALGIDA